MGRGLITVEVYRDGEVRYTRTMVKVINGQILKTCSNCKKVVYLSERDAEHAVGCYVFCVRCDHAYYSWKINTGSVFAEDFLKSHEARAARLPGYARNYFLGATSLGKEVY